MAGGTAGANAGTLVFMVGSKNDENFNLARVVLEGMGKKIFNCGGPGNGSATKISHNLTLGINMIASIEGIVLGEKLGIDPGLLVDILQSSTSANACMGIYNPYPGINPNAPSSRDYEGGFQTTLMKKDIGLAVQAAEENGVTMDLGKKAWTTYDNID
jgi:3-hydroxyisobutyrate dehydrogenase